MKTSSVYGWLLATGVLALAGCNLFPHVSNTKDEKNDKEPLALPGAPSKYSMRIAQFFFFSDVELRRDAPLFKDLTNLREQVHRELHLPPSDREVLVYLFENKDRYEKFIHVNHPKLPDRRAFFVAQAVRPGGAQELMVYTYASDTMQRDLRHELTHAMLHSVLKGVPIWLDEGLAEYFEVPAGQHGLNAKHLEPLRKPGVRFDLDRLERLEEVHQMKPAEYRESWAWVHLMLRSTPQANKALMSYLQDLRTTANPGPLRPRLATAFVSLDSALDTHLAELERALPRGASAQR